MDKSTESQTPSDSKACCSNEKSRCRNKRCCVAKALGAVLIVGLVGALAFCAGTRHAQANAGAAKAAKLAVQTDNIPVLRP